MADTDRITMETIKENGDVDGRQEGQGGDTEEASDELWDIFRKDRFDDDSSMFHGFTDKFFKVIKLLTYGFLFLAPLASVIATRGTLQILTNIIGNEQYYGKESVSQDVVSYFLFFIITIPDALRFLKTLLQVIFVAPSLNPLEFTVVIVTIPAVIGFVHVVAYCGRRRKTEYGWNTRKIVKQLLNLVAMFLLLGLLIGVPVIITQNSTVISSKAEFIGWEIASVVLLSTRWIETYSSRNIGKKGCSIPITENQRLARSSDTRIHSIERKMTDSPKSTPNRESHSEEGGPIHGKNVDEDDSNWTTIKPSTEAVGQEIRCSFDKDSLSSRADQNDDNSESSNSKVKFCEKKSDDIHPTCDDTTTDNNAVAVATSNVKGSNKEPTDQGDNREQTNLKDGGNETKNVEVTSETYIGNKNNGMEENASNDEDNSKGTTSKPSTEVVGQEKSCSFDKDSSPSRADQGDNRERVNLKDGENRINNVEVTSETNIGYENNGMEENASNDEDNSKGTTIKPSTEDVGKEKSCSFDKDSSPSRADQGDNRERVNLKDGENRINNVEVTSETNIGDENNGMEENASDDEDNSKGTTSKPSTEEVGREKSCSFDKHSSPSRADQGDKRERVNLENGENRINNVEVTSETNIGDENNGMEENASNDEDNSKGTTSKPSTEDVGQEKSCSFDKDSSPSRADQGDNRERVNLKNGENRINNVEVTSETNIGDENNGMEENASNDEDNSKGTTIKPSTEDVGKEKSCSFDKDSSPSRADQGDNRERVNLKDGENRINNVEVTSETNIGDENNGMEENASDDEDNSKGTTSKPSTEEVGREKSCSFDKHSSPSRADQGDKRERVNLENGENRINNVEVTSETNIGDENNGMEENASNDEDNSKGTTSKPSTEDVGQEKSCSFDKDSSPSRADQGDNRERVNLKNGENRINNVEVTSETNIGDENNGMEENASNDEDNSKGTTIKPSTEDVGKEKSCSFDKDSSPSRADQGDNREQTNMKDGQNRINNVEVTTETYIGDENNGMEENASNDEDNSKGTTSKPSTEVVGREKSFRFDKDSSSSRAHEKDENDESNWNIDADKCQNSSDEQVADIDLKSNAKNKAEKIKKNISEVQNALKQSHSSDSPSMERVKGLRRPREDTTKKLVDDIKQSRETEKQTKIQAEVKSVRQTSNSKYDEKNQKMYIRLAMAL
ncbi:hypothetical protein FSP39_021821 [Pinctada imbricata]|uniref:Uncharacterized protein n=1 Tax=Pinctada imbricata TaxID=66713 RepID=A0AA88Y0X9_PINIB|nr:hypothetical protein FSP39_021821 [Pinctada imbricata]